MYIFEVLSAISKRKKAFMNSGTNENEALINAEIDVLKDYHIPLFDIKIRRKIEVCVYTSLFVK